MTVAADCPQVALASGALDLAPRRWVDQELTCAHKAQDVAHWIQRCLPHSGEPPLLGRLSQEFIQMDDLNKVMGAKRPLESRAL